jgi:hypothetical protein
MVPAAAAMHGCRGGAAAVGSLVEGASALGHAAEVLGLALGDEHAHFAPRESALQGRRWQGGGKRAVATVSEGQQPLGRTRCISSSSSSSSSSSQRHSGLQQHPTFGSPVSYMASAASSAAAAANQGRCGIHDASRCANRGHCRCRDVASPPPLLLPAAALRGRPASSNHQRHRRGAPPASPPPPGCAHPWPS